MCEKLTQNVPQAKVMRFFFFTSCVIFSSSPYNQAKRAIEEFTNRRDGAMQLHAYGIYYVVRGG